MQNIPTVHDRVLVEAFLIEEEVLKMAIRNVNNRSDKNSTAIYSSLGISAILSNKE